MRQPHALIIDDDVRNTAVLAGMLSKQGVVSTQVNDTSKLTSALKGIAQVDVVFLDLEMPGLNGYEVLTVMKSDKRFHDVTFVACTVYIGEMNTAHQSGFSGFISKPLDADRFPDQLQRILNGEAVWERE